MNALIKNFTLIMNWLKSDIGRFILKVIGIYFCWYLIYELWLLPEGSLDEWLTTNIVSITAGILDLFNYEVFARGRMVGIENTPGIYLANGCSGISAIGLFIGFIIAYPGEWFPRFNFVIIGICIIYLTNIIRNIILSITQLHWPSLFEITHNYSTVTIFYMIIFALWVIWANYGSK